MALADSSCSEHQSDQNSRLPHKTRLRGLRCFRQMPLLHEALRYMFESCNSARKTKRKSCPVRSLQHLHHAPARLNLFPCEKLRLICGNQLTAAKVAGSYSVIMPFLQALPYMLIFTRSQQGHQLQNGPLIMWDPSHSPKEKSGTRTRPKMA